MDQKDEEALVEAASKGDHAAIRLLWEWFLPAQIAYCRNRGLQFDDARDVAQNCWVDIVLTKLTTYRSEKGRFGGWVILMTRRAMQTSWRRRRPDKLHYVPVELLADVPSKGDAAPTDSSVESLLDLLRGRLTRQERRLYDLMLEGISLKKAAKRLGITYSAARKRWQRLREKLVGLLPPDLEV